MSREDSPRVATQWLVLAVLVGLVVAGLGFFAFALVDKNRTDAVTDEVAEVAQTRQDLRDLAAEFVRELHTYGPDDLEGERLAGYDARVSALMTAKFRAAFQQSLPITETTVAQFSTRSAADTTASGVAVLNDDTAEVLVGGWVLLAYQHPTSPEKEVVGDQQSVRYRVILQQVEGEWLVDRLCNIEDVSGANCLGEDAAPQGTPSDLPTEGGGTPTEPTSPSGSEEDQGSGESDDSGETDPAAPNTTEEAP